MTEITYKKIDKVSMTECPFGQVKMVHDMALEMFVGDRWCRKCGFFDREHLDENIIYCKKEK